MDVELHAFVVEFLGVKDSVSVCLAIEFDQENPRGDDGSQPPRSVEGQSTGERRR